MGNKLRGAWAQIINVLKEMTNRSLGLLDLLFFFIGFRPDKKLRMRVVILRDEEGNPLATEAEVMPSVVECQRVFMEAANTQVVPAGPVIFTVLAPSPTAALNVHCDDGAWQEDFDVAGNYFRKHMAKNFFGTILGYAAPVTVFIVRDISLKGGCSLGPLADYVTLEAQMLNRAKCRILAHEVAHACGLFHSEDKPNMMYPKGPGDLLLDWQTAVLRNSRHVTYF